MITKSQGTLFVWVLWGLSRFLAALFAANHPPALVLDLYLPFAKNFVGSPDLDPWASWLEMGGNPEAFPYSWPLLAFVGLALVLGSFFSAETLGWIAATVLVDLIITVFIIQTRDRTLPKSELPAFLWTLSPTPLIGLGLLGSLDFLPSLFLALFVVTIHTKRFAVSGLLLGLAISSKVLIAVALFAVLVFAFRSKASQREASRLVVSTAVWSAALTSPLFYSESFRQALTSSTSALGPLTWGVGGQGLTIFVWPLAILFVWLVTWNLRRFSDELLVVAIGTPLMLTAAMPGAAPGWSTWSLPLILPLLSRLPKRYVFFGFSSLNLSAFGSAIIEPLNFLSGADQALLESSFSTMTIGTSLFFLYLAWRELVTKSDFVRLHARPALVLIAGDSGVGKDTLSDGLSRALGEKSTVRVSGDDYHLWDRGKGAWNFITHLNPQANDLPKFYDDVLKLTAGEEILVGHYDHKYGRRLTPASARSREFVVVSGLHALWSNEVNSQSQLTVFIEMSDDLRVKFKLSRDLTERSQNEEFIRKSIERRRRDAKEYIQPQAQMADLVVSISPLEKEGPPTNQELRFLSDPKLFDNRLVSELSNTCGLEVFLEKTGIDKRVITVRGSASSQSLAMAIERLEPRFASVVQIENNLSEGAPGIIQMVTLVYLSNSLRLDRLL